MPAKIIKISQYYNHNKNQKKCCYFDPNIPYVKYENNYCISDTTTYITVETKEIDNNNIINSLLVEDNIISFDCLDCNSKTAEDLNYYLINPFKLTCLNCESLRLTTNFIIYQQNPLFINVLSLTNFIFIEYKIKHDLTVIENCKEILYVN